MGRALWIALFDLEFLIVGGSLPSLNKRSLAREFAGGNDSQVFNVLGDQNPKFGQ